MLKEVNELRENFKYSEISVSDYDEITYIANKNDTKIGVQQGLSQVLECNRQKLRDKNSIRKGTLNYCKLYKDRKACYENVSRKNLGENCTDHICTAPDAKDGYRFSKAMKNPGFISIDDIINTYLPLGFSNFKIEGRGLGSAVNLEFLLYYLIKPEYQFTVREEIYLDSMLDLF